MSQGLPKPGEMQNDDVSEDEDNIINPKSTKKKEKTLKQKRKQREQLLLVETRRKSKVEKKKIADLSKLKAIQKSIEKTDQKVQKLREKRKKVLAYKSKEPKRIGPLKFEEPDLEFNASTDISGNLVHMKKEGNLLLDRFKSLQKRNIVPPSKIVNPKKAKVKKYTKPGYKDDWKNSIAGF